MNGREEIEQRREQIAAVCREHEVARLLYGSVLRDDFDPETSDIDFLAEFQPGVNKGWLSEYTDLVSERGVINPYILATVEREKVLLYAA